MKAIEVNPKTYDKIGMEVYPYELANLKTYIELMTPETATIIYVVVRELGEGPDGAGRIVPWETFNKYWRGDKVSDDWFDIEPKDPGSE